MAGVSNESSEDERKSKKVKLDKNRVIRKTSVDLYQDQKDWLDKNVPNMGELFRAYTDKLIADGDEQRLARDRRSIEGLEFQIKGWKESLAKEDFGVWKRSQLNENIKQAERVLAYKRRRGSLSPQ